MAFCLAQSGGKKVCGVIVIIIKLNRLGLSVAFASRWIFKEVAT